MTQADIDNHNKLCDEAMARFVDGPWKSEPHRIQFNFEGLDCLMVRNFALGHWCGYVGVPKGHPAYGVSYNDEPVIHLDSHHGLTYSDFCSPPVCHVTAGDDDLWWLGFDCAHLRDLTPGIFTARAPGGPLHYIQKMYPIGDLPPDIYRDVRYVTSSVEMLASELRKLAS